MNLLLKLSLFFSSSILFVSLSYSQTDSTKKTAAIQRSKIWKSDSLRKGIYKSYKEFINNEPSITDEFSVYPVSCYVEYEDTIFSFKYVFVDTSLANLDASINNEDKTVTISRTNERSGEESEATEEASPNTQKMPTRPWGFCDGENVYVRTWEYGSKYWKLNYIGPFSFFKMGTTERNMIFIPIPIASILAVAASATLSAISFLNSAETNMQLLYVNEEGKFARFNSASLKKTLQKYDPELLAEFKSTPIYHFDTDESKKQFLFRLNETVISKE